MYELSENLLMELAAVITGKVVRMELTMLPSVLFVKENPLSLA